MSSDTSTSASGPNSIAVVLTVIGLLTAGATVGVGPVAAQSTQSESDEYAIVQGDDCFTVEAFGNGSESVEEFYDYRTPETEPSSPQYGSFGTTHLQADDTSVLFLYEGSEGTSLVVVHDQVDGDSPGGAVTMQIDGLPEDGEWVVEDDNYSVSDGPYDEFEHGETSSRITWTYTDNRSDGAAFRGLEGEFDVTIDPAFNDDADFRVYDGEITDWEALSPTDDGHERTSLDMSQPVEIRPGPCTSVTATAVDVTADEPVTAGDDVEIEATVENDGATAGTFDVPITVDGEVVDEREVTLEPGETTTVSTSVTLESDGAHTIEVASATTEIGADSTEDGNGNADDGSEDELSGFGLGIAVAALATLLAVSLARSRR